MFVECSHQEAVKEVVKTLKNHGYLVKTEAWISRTLTSPENFRYNVANAFLGKESPWITLHDPQYQTRLDVIGVYYADYAGMPLYTFFVTVTPPS